MSGRPWREVAVASGGLLRDRWLRRLVRLLVLAVEVRRLSPSQERSVRLDRDLQEIDIVSQSDSALAGLRGDLALLTRNPYYVLHAPSASARRRNTDISQDFVRALDSPF